MNRRAIQLVLVAALVAIAGCAGGMGGEPTQSSTNDDGNVMDSSDGVGTAAFYVSDEPNVIDDFEHLNVTITKVGFKKAGSAGDGDANESDGEERDADDGNESTNETATDETDGETGNETDADGEQADEEDEEKADGDGGDDGESESEWIEYDVNETTVDLTELKGANASMIDEFELPAGEYETVFIYVSDTEGVLTNGSTTRVKLPSNKLQLHTTFTVGNNESVDFVYDIAPHKAGKSGKYILKPVISQSGTGDKVEIRDVDEEQDDEETDGEKGKPDGNGDGKAKEQPQEN
ncbi:DUF4382 domain-containing protein [Natrinema sp. 1APR25-10V2]|uniref:DUF4382 domain-containing protein n=1 Tax=Natrinema sp. 1APR25-10V2 TaxID=2951081 RepID=UPI002874ADC9|nr:DUF4382 domain-containing protein [Natrinema sp. 1APR25-10V2]MDS0476304.1 DUF4382 domain-containing protein [Natrinema sp. 1APR25-10V2]